MGGAVDVAVGAAQARAAKMRADATTLTYYADDPLGPVVFYRETFESPEP